MQSPARAGPDRCPRPSLAGWRIAHAEAALAPLGLQGHQLQDGAGESVEPGDVQRVALAAPRPDPAPPCSSMDDRPVPLLEGRAVKLNMTAAYGASGFSRPQLVVCCDDLLRVLEASETKDPSVDHATVVADLLSGTLEVAVQAEGDTYDEAAALASRQLDQAIATVMDDSRASLTELHSEVWCRKTPDICRTRAAQEASEATRAEPEARRVGRPYAFRLLIFRLVAMCGCAAAAVFAISAVHPGGPDMLLITGAVLSALFATAAWIYMTLADVSASRKEPRRPEDAER